MAQRKAVNLVLNEHDMIVTDAIETAADLSLVSTATC